MLALPGYGISPLAGRLGCKAELCPQEQSNKTSWETQPRSPRNEAMMVELPFAGQKWRSPCVQIVARWGSASAAWVTGQSGSRWGGSVALCLGTTGHWLQWRASWRSTTACLRTFLHCGLQYFLFLFLGPEISLVYLCMTGECMSLHMF